MTNTYISAQTNDLPPVSGKWFLPSAVVPLEPPCPGSAGPGPPLSPSPPSPLPSATQCKQCSRGMLDSLTSTAVHSVQPGRAMLQQTPPPLSPLPPHLPPPPEPLTLLSLLISPRLCVTLFLLLVFPPPLFLTLFFLPLPTRVPLCHLHRLFPLPALPLLRFSLFLLDLSFPTIPFFLPPEHFSLSTYGATTPPYFHLHSSGTTGKVRKSWKDSDLPW